jgi:ketosteroid isomerase-like protein
MPQGMLPSNGSAGETIQHRMKRFAFLLLVALLAVGAKFKDKSKPVRAALTARYAELADAWRRRDLDAVLAFKDPHFTSVLPNGQVWDATAAEQATRSAFAAVETTFSQTNELDTILVRGDTAEAAVRQHWVRRQKKGGAMRLVDTRARQHEWWIHLDGQWFLFHVDRVRPGPWYVDGKKVDPSKPYDPDAPPFEGDEE